MRHIASHAQKIDKFQLLAPKGGGYVLLPATTLKLRRRLYSSAFTTTKPLVFNGNSQG
jgi:hypothetical protein